MIIDTSQSFPDTGEVTDRIRRATNAGHGDFLDARHVAETLFGEDRLANILLAGAAFQTDALPLPAEAIEEAITLNGAKVEANIQAFRRGRRRRWAPPTGPPRVRDRFGPGARVSQRLHPPILRTLGMHKKISLGPWSTPVFRLLAGARRLRGTPFDLFGYARVRWVERDANHGLAVTIAGLPDEVRGYEQVKLDNVTRYRQRLNDLRLELKRSHPVSTP